MKSKQIIVGHYSYYSEYYHDHSFGTCVLYLDEEDDRFGSDKIDRLIIGKFCSIATGVNFMLGGNHGHDHSLFTSYRLETKAVDFDEYKNSISIAYKRMRDTVISNDIWIGFEELIIGGVKIADGAVIGGNLWLPKKSVPAKFKLEMGPS